MWLRRLSLHAQCTMFYGENGQSLKLLYKHMCNSNITNRMCFHCVAWANSVREKDWHSRKHGTQAM